MLDFATSIMAQSVQDPPAAVVAEAHGVDTFRELLTLKHRARQMLTRIQTLPRRCSQVRPPQFASLSTWTDTNERQNIPANPIWLISTSTKPYTRSPSHHQRLSGPVKPVSF